MLEAMLKWQTQQISQAGQKKPTNSSEGYLQRPIERPDPNSSNSVQVPVRSSEQDLIDLFSAAPDHTSKSSDARRFELPDQRAIDASTPRFELDSTPIKRPEKPINKTTSKDKNNRHGRNLSSVSFSDDQRSTDIELKSKKPTWKSRATEDEMYAALSYVLYKCITNDNY